MNYDKGCSKQQETEPNIRVLKSSSKGLSIVELIIYIAILSFIAVILTDVFVSITRSKAAVDAKVEVSQNLRFVIDRITKSIQKADAINTPLAGASGALLSLDMPEGSEDATVFDVSSFVLRKTIAAQSAVNITSSEVRVTSLNFQHKKDATSQAKATIIIDITIEYNNASRPYLQYSDSVRTTVSLRK